MYRSGNHNGELQKTIELQKTLVTSLFNLFVLCIHLEDDQVMVCVQAEKKT